MRRRGFRGRLRVPHPDVHPGGCPLHATPAVPTFRAPNGSPPPRRAPSRPPRWNRALLGVFGRKSAPTRMAVAGPWLAAGSRLRRQRLGGPPPHSSSRRRRPGGAPATFPVRVRGGAGTAELFGCGAFQPDGEVHHVLGRRGAPLLLALALRVRALHHRRGHDFHVHLGAGRAFT